MLSAAQNLAALSSLGMTTAPVAVAFLPGPPPAVEPVGRSDTAGDSYRRQASEGRAFYTSPTDHANCPFGAPTHGVSLTPEQGAGLQSMPGTVIELKYIRSDKVGRVLDALEATLHANRELERFHRGRWHPGSPAID